MESQNLYSVAPDKSRHGDPISLRNKHSMSIKVSGSQTEERVAIFECFVSPGAGPILHLHHSQNEWWYVLDGDFLFQSENESSWSSLEAVSLVHQEFRTRFVGWAKHRENDNRIRPRWADRAVFAELAKPGVEDGEGRREILRRFGMEFVGLPLGDA